MGGRWAQLSHCTLRTGALGSLFLFWSNRREFAEKQKRRERTGCQGGRFPSRPRRDRGRVPSSVVLLCWTSGSAARPPRMRLPRRVPVLAWKPKGPEGETRRGWAALAAPSLGRSARRWFRKGSWCFSSARLVPGTRRGGGAEPGPAEPGTAASPSRTCRRLAGSASPNLRAPTASLRAPSSPGEGPWTGDGAGRGSPSPLGRALTAGRDPWPGRSQGLGRSRWAPPRCQPGIAAGSEQAAPAGGAEPGLVGSVAPGQPTNLFPAYGTGCCRPS